MAKMNFVIQIDYDENSSTYTGTFGSSESLNEFINRLGLLMKAAGDEGKSYTQFLMNSLANRDLSESDLFILASFGLQALNKEYLQGKMLKKLENLAALFDLDDESDDSNK